MIITLGATNLQRPEVRINYIQIEFDLLLYI